MIEKQKTSERNTPERNSSSVAGPTPTSLPDDVLEKLYRSYSLKQKRSGLTCLIFASIVFDLWAILVPQGQSVESLGEMSSYVLCEHVMALGSAGLLLKRLLKFHFPQSTQTVVI